MLVDGGRLPTQRACPDCRGFLGGPLSADVCNDEFELVLLMASSLSLVSNSRKEDCSHLEGRVADRTAVPADAQGYYSHANVVKDIGARPCQGSGPCTAQVHEIGRMVTGGAAGADAVDAGLSHPHSEASIVATKGPGLGMPAGHSPRPSRR